MIRSKILVFVLATLTSAGSCPDVPNKPLDPKPDPVSSASKTDEQEDESIKPEPEPEPEPARPPPPPPPPPRPTSQIDPSKDHVLDIFAGSGHACAIVKRKGDSAGELFCWGSNSSCVVGGCDSGWSSERVLKPDLRLLVALPPMGGYWSSGATGDYATLVVHDVSHHLYGFGRNFDGVFGNPALSAFVPKPQAPLLQNGVASEWSQVSVGQYSFCAIRKSDSTLWCAGSSNTSPVVVSTALTNLTPGRKWAFVALERRNTGICAIANDDGSLWCWGEVFGTTSPRRLDAAGGRFTQVALVDGDAFAIQQNGAMWKFEGNETKALKKMPGSWHQVSLGQTGICVIEKYDGSKGGKLFCDSAGPSLEEVRLADGSVRKWKKVAVGYYGFQCAIDSEDSLWCWGKNHSGQLGVGTQTEHAAPQKVVFPSKTPESKSSGGASDIFSAARHTCAIVDTSGAGGELFCWGDNSFCTVGGCENTWASGDLQTVLSPMRHLMGQPPAKGYWSTGATSQFSTFVINSSNHHLYGFGRNMHGAFSNPAAQGIEPRPISPVLVNGVAPEWNYVSASDYSMCAIKKADESLWCVGHSNVDPAIDSPSLTQVAKGVRWASISIASNNRRACALAKGDGSLWCWGAFDAWHFDQPGTATSPRKLSSAFGGNSDFKQVVVQSGEAMALKKDGSWWVFGVEGMTRPRKEAGHWLQVSFGQHTLCAIKQESSTSSVGELHCGSSGDQLRHIVLPGPAARKWKKVSVGAYDHQCAIAEEGEVWCWGKNSSGQLGVGTKVDHPLPQKVVFPSY